MAETKTLVIVGKECIFVKGEFGYDVNEGEEKEFKKWVVCSNCSGTIFELSHGQYQLISRCSACHMTQTEYDG